MKSYVSLAQNQCLICLKNFDINEILLDKRLRPTLECRTLTGHGKCPECNAQIKKGFIALIETAGANPGRKTVGADVARSGNFCFLRREVFDQVFGGPCPNLPFIFIEPGVLEKLQSMQAP